MQALRDTGGTDGGRHPQDFLMFCSLVNREAQRPEVLQQPQQSPAQGLQVSPLMLTQ